jgi:hypothetical protein
MGRCQGREGVVERSLRAAYPLKEAGRLVARRREAAPGKACPPHDKPKACYRPVERDGW